ncbi:MAG: hypothetical protein ACKO45_05155 [Cyanobium sp.]
MGPSYGGGGLELGRAVEWGGGFAGVWCGRGWKKATAPADVFMLSPDSTPDVVWWGMQLE